MSQRGMRTFSTEFKQAVVLRLEAGERIAAVADELKIRRKLLYEWRAAYRKLGASGLNRKRGRKPGGRGSRTARRQIRDKRRDRLIGPLLQVVGLRSPDQFRPERVRGKGERGEFGLGSFHDPRLDMANGELGVPASPGAAFDHRCLASMRDGVLVSEETVSDFQLQPGDTLNLRLQSAADHKYHVVPFRFVGVAREFPTAPRDSFLVANADYLAEHTGDAAAEIVLMRAAGDPETVAAAARKVFADAPGVRVTSVGETQRLISSSLTAIDLRGLTTLELTFAVAAVIAAAGLLFGLDVAERRRGFAVLALNEEVGVARPMPHGARVILIDAIRQAHRWLDNLVSNPNETVEAIASREGKTERSIRMTLSLAFLAPDIVKAAIDGRLPRGFGLKRMVDLPMSWSDQWRVLGLRAPAGP